MVEVDEINAPIENCLKGQLVLLLVIEHDFDPPFTTGGKEGGAHIGQPDLHNIGPKLVVNALDIRNRGDIEFERQRGVEGAQLMCPGVTATSEKAVAFKTRGVDQVDQLLGIGGFYIKEDLRLALEPAQKRL